MLWVIGILFFLFLFYLLVAAIVNKIKEPKEAETRLINAKTEKEKCDKLINEYQIKISEAEAAIKEANEKTHAATVEENRYMSARATLVERYNTAVSKMEYDIEQRAIEKIQFTPELLSSLETLYDVSAFQSSIIKGRLNNAFQNPPIISKLSLSVKMTSNSSVYDVSLTECSCKDFATRKSPCKHMLYLAYLLGILQFNKKLQNEASIKLADTIHSITSAQTQLNLLKDSIEHKKDDLEKLKRKESDLTAKIEELYHICQEAQSLEALQQEKAFLEHHIHDLTLILQEKSARYPQIAEIMADYQTLHYKQTADHLLSKKPPAPKSAEVVLALQRETKIHLKKLNELMLKLAYIEDLFPNINDIFDSDFNEESFELETEETTDRVRLFLSSEEYSSLSTVEKNQLALDRYIESRKSKWQIGRDYEMFVGHKLENEGYKVQYTGIIENLEDMGRDLIASKGKRTLIVQCKNWSQEKTIHEKHIFQLYGTIILYKIDNPLFDVKGVFVTTTVLSEKAKAVANELEIEVIEQFALGDFPRIKCNINRTSGEKIYHLPFDQQYDTTVINKNNGEMYAFTVKEAEDLGFRRAWRHFS